MYALSSNLILQENNYLLGNSSLQFRQNVPSSPQK